MILLRGKQKRFIRSMMMTHPADMQVGKSGITDEFMNQLTMEIEKKEVVKISILQNAPESDPKVVADQLLEKLPELTVVQIIGRNIVMFKKSKNVKNRELSNKILTL